MNAPESGLPVIVQYCHAPRTVDILRCKLNSTPQGSGTENGYSQFQLPFLSNLLRPSTPRRSPSYQVALAHPYIPLITTNELSVPLTIPPYPFPFLPLVLCGTNNGSSTRETSPVDSDSDSGEDTMDVDDGDGDDDDSDGTASDSSGETNLTDPADYREDGKNDASDLAGLLAGNKHLPELYGYRSSLQYNEYMPNSRKLLDRIEQEWFKFCACIKLDPKETYQWMDIKKFYTFFS
ncbi:hypothetical protein EMCG_01711 [[Emmonsia] crescens]|uniref:Uncharacterized protein n=1 Tax=[Emmonsia] crescens TaxID=73230 RepID=A0A0G2I056_9EURO|nr:hypothetical protein EMCG_01711 [Emmonsia crescens UAMH 3008]